MAWSTVFGVFAVIGAVTAVVFLVETIWHVRTARLAHKLWLQNRLERGLPPPAPNALRRGLARVERGLADCLARLRLRLSPPAASAPPHPPPPPPPPLPLLPLRPAPCYGQGWQRLG